MEKAIAWFHIGFVKIETWKTCQDNFHVYLVQQHESIEFWRNRGSVAGKDTKWRVTTQNEWMKLSMGSTICEGAGIAHWWWTTASKFVNNAYKKEYSFLCAEKCKEQQNNDLLCHRGQGIITSEIIKLFDLMLYKEWENLKQFHTRLKKNTRGHDYIYQIIVLSSTMVERKINHHRLCLELSAANTSLVVSHLFFWEERMMRNCA